VDGKLIGSKTVSGVAFNVGAGNAAICGKRGTNTGNGFAGTVSGSLVFSAAMPQVEVEKIKSPSDLWQLFAPQDQRIPTGVAAASGANWLTSGYWRNRNYGAE